MKRVLFVILSLAIFSSAQAKELGKLRVLTYNIWGVFIAPKRKLRAKLIGKEIAKLNPDIIGFQEAFNKKHRQLILSELRASGWGKPYQVYFKKWYGTGIWIVSKYPIEDAKIYHYPVNGYPLNSDFYAKKGVAYARIKTPFGPVDFFNTHMIARYKPVVIKGEVFEEDRLKTDRLLQAFAISAFIQEMNLQSKNRSLIAVGDFNSPPLLLEYKLLKILSGLNNVVDEVELKGCEQGEKSCQLSKRIDHIFYQNYSASNGFYLKPVSARVVLNKPVPSPKGKIKPSDHNGLLVEFLVLSDKDKRVKLGNRSNAQVLLLNEAEKIDYSAIKADLEKAIAHPKERSWKIFLLKALDELNQKKKRWNKIPTTCARILVSDKSALKLSSQDVSRLKKALKLLEHQE